MNAKPFDTFALFFFSLSYWFFGWEVHSRHVHTIRIDFPDFQCYIAAARPLTRWSIDDRRSFLVSPQKRSFVLFNQVRWKRRRAPDMTECEKTNEKQLRFDIEIHIFLWIGSGGNKSQSSVCPTPVIHHLLLVRPRHIAGERGVSGIIPEKNVCRYSVYYLAPRAARDYPSQ
jgi:hypothetical protein